MTTCNHHHHHHEDGHGALIRRMDLLTSGTAGLAAVAMASSGLGIRKPARPALPPMPTRKIPPCPRRPWNWKRAAPHS